MSADSRVRRTGDATIASIRSAIGASHSPAARTCSRPSSLNGGLSPPRPPENFLAEVCLVTPCRTMITVVGSPAPPQPRAGGGWGRSEGLSSSSINDSSSPAPCARLTPSRVPSSASLANRSACVFCARGTHVYVVPAGASSCACAASGFIAGCLIFHRPDICSTTSLESSLASTAAPGASSAASRSPAIRPWYSATLLLATPIAVPSSASTSPVSASLSTAP